MTAPIHEFKLPAFDQRGSIRLGDDAREVLLLVKPASERGFTPQDARLETL